MGQVSSNISNDEIGNLGSQENNTVLKTEIDIDFSKDINPDLKQLLHWSLADVRIVYDKYRRRSPIPFIDRSTFCHLVPYSRMNAIFIFDSFCKNTPYMNIFEFLCVLTVTAYSNYHNKIHMLFLLFDFDCSDSIALEELIVIFISFIMGYCKVTELPIPSYTNLEKYAKIMFLKSDIQSDNQLTLKEIVDWVESNMKAMEIFARFEPQTKMKETVEILKHFRRYGDDEGANILRIMKKASRSDEFYSNMDMIMVKSKINAKPSQRITTKKSKTMKTDHSLDKSHSMSYSTIPKLSMRYSSMINSKPSHEYLNNSYEDKEDTILLEKALASHEQKYGKPTQTHVTKGDDKSFPKSGFASLPKIGDNNKTGNIKESKFQAKNIIIIRGKTITKQEIFRFKEYFDHLADTKKVITNKDFIRAFEDKPHMKTLAPKLFIFLDREARGNINIEQLLKSLYPTIEQEDMNVIQKWIKQYNKITGRGKKLLMNEVKEDDSIKKKRVIPSSSLKRMQELFNLYDEERKGYLVVDNLKKHFKYAFTHKEVEDLFLEHDKDNDGKLTIEDFMRFVLPSDYIIESPKSPDMI